MGFLVPLYLAGLGALALPFLLHLVRRTPRGRQSFSSLMFLSPAPPTLTRRSRLDQLLLLTLRLAALGLLAFAFARPFFREAAALSFDALAGRRVALLVDTSASMRRGDLWQQVLRKVEQELDDLNPQDDVALYTFGDVLTTIVDFQQESDAPLSGKPQLVRKRLRELEPTWQASDLGMALATVAAEIDSATDARQSPLEPQIVVVSDLQKGCRIEALQSYEWPKRIPVVLRQVAPARTTNACAQMLHGEEEGNDDPLNVRVRVINATDSASEQFYVSWGSQDHDVRVADELAVYVPPGQSRVVRLSRPAEFRNLDRIVLRGDDHDFDNVFYVAPLAVQHATVCYTGPDGNDDARGLLYYLRLATSNDPLRQVEVQTLDLSAPPPAPGLTAPQLVVVSQALTSDWNAVLQSFVERGGMLLLVPVDEEAARSLPQFLDDVEPEASSEKGSDYRLLGEMNFAHPLFVPFSAPRYGDFTKVHFWKYRRVALKPLATTSIVARFDNGDPAILDRKLGAGRVMVFTSGWQPDDSQLALSSKFVPLVAGLLDMACGSVDTPASVQVGAAVDLPAPSMSRLVVHTSDGREVPIADKAKTFDKTLLPGIYEVAGGLTPWQFAVNLSTAESDTAPLNSEQLEQRGVRFGSGLTRAERVARVRQERDVELEDRQRIWHWLIGTAVGLLIFETWWAGRADRKIAEVAQSREVSA
jgi:hypothetical protein